MGSRAISQTSPCRGHGAVAARNRVKSGGAGREGTDRLIKVSVEKQIARRVAEAVTRFRMIREGDRVAAAFSGGKDSFTLLEALLRLRERAPITFSVCAFTIEQGKFLGSLEPFGEWMTRRGVEWSYHVDNPSLRLLKDQPEHGCDVCSRFRRRAVYQIARTLGANVIALGHTADDLCESFLRNAMFNGRLGALPAVTWSKEKDFRLIRPLIFVTEDLTRAFAEESDAPVIPCGCSLRTGTVRTSLRDVIATLERGYPQLKATLLKALGNIETSRLLDPRFLDLDSNVDTEGEDLLRPVTEL